MIAIVDYGMGNLRSVEKAFKQVGADARIATRASTIQRADKLVVPGVGAFKRAMQELKRRGLIRPLLKKIGSGAPYLGLCLGMQLLFESSEEEGPVKGLGIFKGKVVRFRTHLKVPHMGWNQVSLSKQKHCPLLKGIPDESSFYFVHSYYVSTNTKDVVAATTDYAHLFPSVIWRDQIYATQFHPEKSQSLGLKMLENFTHL